MRNVITLSDFSVEMARLSYLINDSKYKVQGEDGKISKNNELIKEDLKKHFEAYLSTCRHIGNDTESKAKNKRSSSMKSILVKPMVQSSITSFIEEKS